jgi:hypothetical protein
MQGENWLHESSEPIKKVPQGLKPQVLYGFCGTTKVVPFHGAVYVTSSFAARPNRLRKKSERKANSAKKMDWQGLKPARFCRPYRPG